MAYKRQEFKDFETVLTAEHLDNIQNGILDIQNDLYDVTCYKNGKWLKRNPFDKSKCIN